MKDHRWEQIPRGRRSTVWAIPWPVCARCGLILTRAPVAVRASRAPCSGLDDPPDADQETIRRARLARGGPIG